MSTPRDFSDRLMQLETLVMHLQRDVEALNAVILDQQKQLDGFRGSVGRLDERLSRLDLAEPRFDPLLEKPPHY